MIAWTLSGVNVSDTQTAVEKIYHEHKHLMFTTAAKYIENTEDQEDVVQTALERLVKIFSAPNSLKRCISAGYIVFIIRSVSVDFLRKQGREAKYCVSLEDNQLKQGMRAGVTMDDFILHLENAELLRDIWPQLPADDRILLEGKYILGYSDQELAAILNCKPSSIRMKLTRARRRALKLLSERTEK